VVCVSFGGAARAHFATGCPPIFASLQTVFREKSASRCTVRHVLNLRGAPPVLCVYDVPEPCACCMAVPRVCPHGVTQKVYSTHSTHVEVGPHFACRVFLAMLLQRANAGFNASATRAVALDAN